MKKNDWDIRKGDYRRNPKDTNRRLEKEEKRKNTTQLIKYSFYILLAAGAAYTAGVYLF